MRVFIDAMTKYNNIFQHPPTGKFYLVDSGYPNRSGYLASYKGTRYHLLEYQDGPESQDRDFDRCDRDENYVPPKASATTYSSAAGKG
uniref:Transposon protein, putative, CACTA, En/Spm sub-class n=1 Tax=Saccharum officinarum TaxID=4547 RepID=A0A678TAF5_SACOF|nr:Transposon protein, putative, CACTA, En/Spm sub-class [Saccharum officinarum]